MLLGERLKKAVNESDFSAKEVAEYMGITENNLYRLYKKDSFEIKYLKNASKKLNSPLQYFLDEGLENNQLSNSLQSQYANRVGSNNQQINTGVTAGETECRQQLAAALDKISLLEKNLIDKEMIIELLKNK